MNLLFLVIRFIFNHSEVNRNVIFSDLFYCYDKARKKKSKNIPIFKKNDTNT